MTPSEQKSSHADARHRVSVKIACTIAIISTMSMTGYSTVITRSIGAPLDESMMGVMTQCQITADTDAATIAPSIAASRRNWTNETP